MSEDGRATEAVALPAGAAAGGSALYDSLAGEWTRWRGRLGLAAIPALGRRIGLAALGCLGLGALAIVLFASSGPTGLVSRSRMSFTGWEAGPLHGLVGHLALSTSQLTLAYSVFLVAMTVAYAVALLAARSLPPRAVWAFATTVPLILLLGPPLQLTDLFNYLGYARLGALHGLNPYTHGIGIETFDPVNGFVTWRNLASPYGPLFTAITYPIAWLPLPVAYWSLKAVVVGLALAFFWLVGRCAKQLGRDPHVAVLFVAANPIMLFYEIGGFHNDFFMLVPSMGAIALLLSRRDRAAGVAIMAAVAVKFTTVMLLPFLLIGALPAARRPKVALGAVLGVIPLAVMTFALFGTAMPNVADQSGLVTGFSIPNLVGLGLGLGGSTHGLLQVFDLAVVAVVLFGLRRPRDWVARAGWATLALTASIAWLMPWYVVWTLPLAAVAGSVRLRRVTLAFTVFLVLTFAPETSTFLDSHGLNPMATPSGEAAVASQLHLQD